MRRLVSELTWLTRLLTDLAIPPPIPIPIHSDSQIALHIARNPIFHERTKHVELDCHFVRQQYLSGLISLSFVPYKDQLADIFTKSFAGPPHHQNLCKLGVTYFPSNLRGYLVRSQFSVIDCMSNSTISTLATSSSSHASAMVAFSSDLNNDLLLTWDEPNCQNCEAKRCVCGFKNSTTGEIQCFDASSPGTGSPIGIEIFQIVALALVIPAITCSMGVTLYIYYGQCRENWQAEAAPQNTTPGGAAVAPQPEVTIGLDDLTIQSYTKVVLGESRRVPGPNHGICQYVWQITIQKRQ
ncbi:putative repetitive proline-rich cell wall protein 2-like [Capsicum annuum]|nr:putative repetitive proline-rich cell wall protein 2-like [Capsicum annuum]